MAPLIPALYEFKTNLVYMTSVRPELHGETLYKKKSKQKYSFKEELNKTKQKDKWALIPGRGLRTVGPRDIPAPAQGTPLCGPDMLP